MGRFSKNQRVIRMRSQFKNCPGCGRGTDQLVRDREREYPGKPFNLNELITVDHIVPLSEGGSNDFRNLALCCNRCNFTRGSQHPWDWFGEQHLVFAQGWPIPREFYGSAGRENARLWRNRAAAIQALLGFGPVEFEGEIESLS